MTFQPTHKTMAALAVAATVLVAIATVSALAAISSSRTIQNSGTVRTVAAVGVYWDSGCSNTTSIVQWGALSPGTSNSVTLYVRNEGNVALKLALATSNWNPAEASSYMTLGWNRQSYTLNAGSTVQATLTLSVSSSITGIANFIFDIIISGTE